MKLSSMFATVVLGGVFAALSPGGSPTRAGGSTDLDVSLDQLLGSNRRSELKNTLRQRDYGGRTYSWEQYTAWGRELIVTGSVKQPPTGPSPSKALATQYRCVHCHNLVREDAKLTVQDSESRERLIRQAAAPEPEKRDGTVLSLTPGTTLWGAVNRERFYNGRYDKYHKLLVADGRVMDRESLADAIQICSRYCSAGRYPEPWEIDSMLAHLWDLELRLKDLDLPPARAQEILRQLKQGDEREREQAREVLRRSYLRIAGATVVELPGRSDGDVDIYPDGTKIRGNAKAGKLLYQSACAGCHGTAVHALAGADLAADDTRFHQFTWQGTDRKGMYMPFFTPERLSRPQAADIRAYLRSLASKNP